jgi:hypothetical protein
MVAPVPKSVATEATKIGITNGGGRRRGKRRRGTRRVVGGGWLDDDVVAVRLAAAHEAELVRAKGLRQRAGAAGLAAATDVATVKVAIRADLTIDNHGGRRRRRCFGGDSTIAVALGNIITVVPPVEWTRAFGAIAELAVALAGTIVAPIKIAGRAGAAIDHEGMLRTWCGGDGDVVDGGGGGGCIRVDGDGIGLGEITGGGQCGRVGRCRQEEEKERRRLEKLHRFVVFEKLYNLYGTLS